MVYLSKIPFMNKDLVDLLGSLTEPISVIERKLGIPSSTLAKAKSGERDLPRKWAVKLVRYLDNCLTEGSKDGTTLVELPEWASEIINFCDVHNITPSDLTKLYINIHILKLPLSYIHGDNQHSPE